jgi:hypothetical protein
LILSENIEETSKYLREFSNQTAVAKENMSTQNSSISFNLLDLTVDKSIDMISQTFRQVFQLIFCFIFLFVVGKLSSFLNSQFSSSQTTSPDDQQNSDLIGEESDVEPKKISPPESAVDEKVERILNANNGWESEQLKDDGVLQRKPDDSPSNNKSKNLQTKTINKQLKRKCMSVGPVLLTPTSQIIRSLNAEDREERYTYNILPRETLITTTDSSDRVDVCVPYVILFISPTCELFMIKIY